ncbi:MAG: hypothetical protein ACLRFM_02030 [Alphaproteobacteria bacterium]
MSVFNKIAVMIVVAVCATNSWAADVMKKDSNAIGILDCVYTDDSVPVWEDYNSDCSAKHNSWSHNYHSTKAVCKWFVADAYYKKYKDDTGMTDESGLWPDSVVKLPKLVDGEYMMRCVATECEDGYELARDKNGNSQGWCRKKTERSDAAKVSTGDAGQGEQGQTVNGDVPDGVIVPENPDQGQDKHVKSTDGDEAQKSAFDFSELDKMLDKHFVSRYSDVWKNSDGNFNTARLASDSIAGVVLGTTGGVITSKIVKKNQIKSGFESLKCTIAGQDVATYGDDFTVGVN